MESKVVPLVLVLTLLLLLTQNWYITLGLVSLVLLSSLLGRKKA